MTVTSTAAVTATAEASRARRGRLALVALLLFAGTVVGCGNEPRIYAIGEGAPDTVGYERAYSEGGGASGIGAPATPVQKWSVGCRQSFTGGASKTAVLLQHPCGENRQVFAVTDDFWDLYRTAGDEASVRYGFPIGRRAEWKEGSTQGFGHGGGLSAFFMQRPGQSPHVLSAPMLDYYLSFDDRAERFGYPTAPQVTTTDGRRCQQFEQAVVTATKDGYGYSYKVHPTGGDSLSGGCASPSPTRA